ncbi:amino acid ABC transporter substrate-binding protein [Flavitalea sp. BT771]|uniref:amino acid ABC transporter substrate-binding protein n=1 Tax=Flavitalea sp. BT771 TaxID=3063329 RepID=UPI0026E134EE|nr:amino acid ABC transporter substrate-binding protein [Flavitalea sp. BT771]MDO6429190.1 amino acid ABC transporter substrate-binding protein [Flavitalea sp. BT771]MDV6218682.1 amino acid ABC transporter substrate-binding protein [Flavitalea sp. BT771]
MFDNHQMKATSRYYLLCILLATTSVVRAQVTDSTRRTGDTLQHRSDSGINRHKVAIFLPLYLDSAFDASNNYRYDKNFPKFINPGLEFYEGAQLALDSLVKENAKLEVHIYDTRSSQKNIAQVLQSPEFQRTELIIGHVGTGELQQLAAAAAQMNVPFINVNFPNDGGITNNPEFVILNSTLKTHCEGIYRFIQRNYPTKPIILFRKKGTQEDRLKNYFDEIGKTTNSVPLKIKYVTLDDVFDVTALTPHLDSSTQTICVAGSLDENFARMLCQGLASVNKTYTSLVIGMPTWDNIDFSHPEFNGEEIVYSTPFYINQTDALVRNIQQYYKLKFYSRPTDMVFRGYETTYRFSRQLLHTGKSLSGSLGEKKFKIFTDFDIQPVFLNRQNMTLDYFENKKLYFIKKVDGAVTGVY